MTDMIRSQTRMTPAGEALLYMLNSAKSPTAAAGTVVRGVSERLTSPLMRHRKPDRQGDNGALSPRGASAGRRADSSQTLALQT